MFGALGPGPPGSMDKTVLVISNFTDFRLRPIGLGKPVLRHLLFKKLPEQINNKLNRKK